MLARRFRLVLLSATAAAVSLTFCAPASAGVLVASATGCQDQVLEQPFLPWADPAHYVLAPDGGLERKASGWSLGGGAAVVSGNESFYVRDAKDSRSLALPAGTSATTPAMCVGIDHPTLRLFARNRGSLLGTLAVEVLFEDSDGNVRAAPLGSPTGTSSWQPTPPLPVVANLLALLPGEHTAVAFRFTPQGGDWQIDDVYVDPYRSR